MAVTEILRGLGSWSVSLNDEVPKEILDKMKYFGHIAVNNGKVNPKVAGDSLLRSSRYVGVYRGNGEPGEGHELKGAGMAFWLGDEDGKGWVTEGQLVFNGATFTDVVNSIVPDLGPVSIGTISGLPETFTGRFYMMSPRQALDYVTSTLGAEYRVNGDASLDAGLEADLFVVNPKAAIVRRQAGVDLTLRAFQGDIKTERDVEDFTTRVVLIAENDGDAFVTATADIDPGLNPFLDIHGNPVKMTRVASESTTETANADARAQLMLNKFSGSRDAISLSTSEFDVKGDVAVGDYVWVFDPDLGVQDLANEVNFLGTRIYPMKLRLIEFAWPIVAGMSVSFRTGTGEWLDLTPYLQYETGSSQLKVGGYNRSLVGGDDGGVIGTRPQPNTSIPGIPTWTTPFQQTVYQSAINGETKAQTRLVWTRPLNVDGSPIVDGDHFEIRYRTSTTPIFPSTHLQMEAFTHEQLEGGTHEQPINYVPGPWTTRYVDWSDLSTLIQELVANMPYEAQIRAVDGAVPANLGEWSAVTVWQTSGDTLAPADPAPPTVASSRIAIQVTHTLGRSDGGTYNLDADLHHFEVHGAQDAGFTPSSTTMLGKLIANNSMIQAQVPAVGTLQVESVNAVYVKVVAVDASGNKSNPSAPVSATALLIDNAHISDLTVTKVTAGTISADWLVGAMIRTAVTGSRVQMNPSGLEAYNSSNVRTVFIKASDGSMEATGSIQSGLTGTRIVLNPLNVGTYIPEMRLYPTSGSTYAYINSPSSSGVATLGMNSGESASGQMTLWLFHDNATLGYTTVGSGVVRGPQLRLTNTFAALELFNTSAQNQGSKIRMFDNFIEFGWTHPDGRDWFIQMWQDGMTYWKGKMSEGQSWSGNALFWAAHVEWNGGAVGFSYGATMSGMFMNVTWVDYTGYLAAACNAYNPTATGFSAGNGTAARNGTYSAWVYRA